MTRIRPGDAASLYALKSHPDVTARYGQEPHASPDDTRLWPGHNYAEGLTDTTLGREKLSNRFLRSASLEQFLGAVGV